MENRIKELRNERGLRQEDLAEIINVSQQTISRLETEKIPCLRISWSICRDSFMFRLITY